MTLIPRFVGTLHKQNETIKATMIESNIRNMEYRKTCLSTFGRGPYAEPKCEIILNLGISLKIFVYFSSGGFFCSAEQTFWVILVDVHMRNV